MSLLSHHALPRRAEYAIWAIAESEDFFRAHLSLSTTELEQVNRIKGEGRRLEWLASRYLIHLMSGREKRGVLLKDEFGKPRLEDSPFHISISHSNRRAAAIAAPFSVGIDLQKIVGKIERIAHKYMRTNEMESLKEETRLEHLHVYWGAKEALYKAYGRKKLDFREHILIEPFEYDLEKGKAKGIVQREDFLQVFELHYELLDDFVLVYALEQEETNDSHNHNSKH
ncbi:MAG: 4'-phosphopantetheinyl transferase superfamily protein [Bacteroidota bacterium]